MYSIMISALSIVIQFSPSRLVRRQITTKTHVQSPKASRTRYSPEWQSCPTYRQRGDLPLGDRFIRVCSCGVKGQMFGWDLNRSSVWTLTPVGPTISKNLITSPSYDNLMHATCTTMAKRTHHKVLFNQINVHHPNIITLKPRMILWEKNKTNGPQHLHKLP